MILKKGFPALVVLFLAIISFAPATPAHANNPDVFVKNFAISKWHLHFSYHNFNCDKSDNGVLTIQKAISDKQIYGGFVLLNGQFILLRNFLTGADSKWNRTSPAMEIASICASQSGASSLARFVIS